MFIKITNPTNPLRLENTLRDYKNGVKEFTPEIAREILTMTNHKKNIYDMLSIIADLPKDKQDQYKKIVLSTFDHREQPTETIILAKKIATANGYEKRLNTIINKAPETYEENSVMYASATHKIIYVCVDREPYLSDIPADTIVYCTNNVVDLRWKDLPDFEVLKFKEKSNVDLKDCPNLPSGLDVSMCNYVDLSQNDLSPIKSITFRKGSYVNLSECENLPSDLDVTMCKEVKLSETNLSEVSSLHFEMAKKVNLYKCEDLPEDLDVSTCDEVSLGATDLSEIKNLKFKEGSIVKLFHCQNLPEDLDVSTCDEVDLCGTDLSEIKHLKFKEGSVVNLNCCKNIPADLDVSMCNDVTLEFTDLSAIKFLKFRAGSKVSLARSKTKLPENLDVSMCETIYLIDADSSKVKTIKFKNPDQQRESDIRFPENWNGKINYSEYTISSFFKSFFSR